MRGFDCNNAGSIPTVFRLVSSETLDMGFNQSPNTPGGFPPGPEGERLRRQVEQFVFAFDTNLASIVGQQVTRTEENGAVVGPR